eukprot:GFYU01046944.1.p1 GENE.GFYU01046944.1~~GFYU01046944.1.p1  ORF type:complete len:123 (-),score=24.56 GFYU01046944.1:62-430(-)
MCSCDSRRRGTPSNLPHHTHTYHTSPIHLQEHKMFMDSLAEFETRYLSKVLSRMFEPIDMMFSNSSKAPSPSEVSNIIGIITTELHNVEKYPTILSKVVNGVGKAVSLFAVKVESSVSVREV